MAHLDQWYIQYRERALQFPNRSFSQFHEIFQKILQNIMFVSYPQRKIVNTPLNIVVIHLPIWIRVLLGGWRTSRDRDGCRERCRDVGWIKMGTNDGRKPGTPFILVFFFKIKQTNVENVKRTGINDCYYYIIIKRHLRVPNVFSSIFISVCLFVRDI